MSPLQSSPGASSNNNNNNRTIATNPARARSDHITTADAMDNPHLNPEYDIPLLLGPGIPHLAWRTGEFTIDQVFLLKRIVERENGKKVDLPGACSNDTHVLKQVTKLQRDADVDCENAGSAGIASNNHDRVNASRSPPRPSSELACIVSNNAMPASSDACDDKLKNKTN